MESTLLCIQIVVFSLVPVCADKYVASYSTNYHLRTDIEMHKIAIIVGMASISLCSIISLLDLTTFVCLCTEEIMSNDLLKYSKALI